MTRYELFKKVRQVGTGKRIIKNTGFVLISEVVNKLLSLFFIAYAARVLGPEDFGFYALIGTVSFLFFYFGNVGIGPMAVREIARDKTKTEKLFSHILSLRVSLVVLSYPLLVLVVSLLGYRDDVKHLIYLAGLSAICSTFSGSFGILYVAYERFKTPVLISILVSLLANLSNVLVLYSGYGLKGIVVVSFLGSATGAVISGIWIRKKLLRYRLVFDLAIWKDMIFQSMPFAFITFFQQANRHMNILFLSKLPSTLPGAMAMGYYNPAASICQAALMLPGSFGQAVLPTIASNSGNLKMVGGIIDKSTKSLLAMVIIPLILATTFFPKEIITLFFGKEYLPSAPALTILGWAYALQVFNAPVTVTLSASKEIRKFVPWILFLFGLNLTLVVPLIYYYSFIGAAIAVLLSKIVETILRNYLLQTIWGIKRLEIKEYGRILFPLIFMLIVMSSVKLISTSVALLLILTFALYTASILVFKDYRQGMTTLINGLRKRTMPEGTG